MFIDLTRDSEDEDEEDDEDAAGQVSYTHINTVGPPIDSRYFWLFC